LAAVTADQLYQMIKEWEGTFPLPAPYVTVDVGTFDAATGAFQGLKTEVETDPEPIEHGAHDHPKNPPPKFVGNLWEEASWSGFVTNRLQARFGPLKASLIVAPLFGLYHLPLFFIIAGLDSGPNHLPLAQFPLYLAFLLIVFSGPMRILLTWIYNSTGQSLPVVSLFHASINATGGVAILATYFAGVDGLLLYAALAGMAVAVIAATRGRLGLPRTDGVEVRPMSPAQPAGSPSIA